jgi:hypothetical protein
MYETIICYDIKTSSGEIINDKHEVNVYLVEGDNIMNDFRAIKRELEKKLGFEVITFTYRYK